MISIPVPSSAESVQISISLNKMLFQTQFVTSHGPGGGGGGADPLQLFLVDSVLSQCFGTVSLQLAALHDSCPSATALDNILKSAHNRAPIIEDTFSNGDPNTGQCSSGHTLDFDSFQNPYTTVPSYNNNNNPPVPSISTTCPTYSKQQPHPHPHTTHSRTPVPPVAKKPVLEHIDRIFPESMSAGQINQPRAPSVSKMLQNIMPNLSKPVHSHESSLDLGRPILPRVVETGGNIHNINNNNNNSIKHEPVPELGDIQTRQVLEKIVHEVSAQAVDVFSARRGEFSDSGASESPLSVESQQAMPVPLVLPPQPPLRVSKPPAKKKKAANRVTSPPSAVPLVTSSQCYGEEISPKQVDSTVHYTKMEPLLGQMGQEGCLLDRGGSGGLCVSVAVSAAQSLMVTPPGMERGQQASGSHGTCNRTASEDSDILHVDIPTICRRLNIEPIDDVTSAVDSTTPLAGLKFRCPVCQRAFQDSSGVSEHLTTAHIEPAQKAPRPRCPVCRKKVKRFDFIRLHLKQVHSMKDIVVDKLIEKMLNNPNSFS